MKKKLVSLLMTVSVFLSLTTTTIATENSLNNENSDVTNEVVISEFQPLNITRGVTPVDDVAWNHYGWVTTDVPYAGMKEARCYTYAKNLYTGADEYHYSRAQLKMFGSVWADSGRQFRSGYSHAESGVADAACTGYTFYGN